MFIIAGGSAGIVTLKWFTLETRDWPMGVRQANAWLTQPISTPLFCMKSSAKMLPEHPMIKAHVCSMLSNYGTGIRFVTSLSMLRSRIQDLPQIQHALRQHDSSCNS